MLISKPKINHLVDTKLLKGSRYAIIKVNKQKRSLKFEE